MNEKVLNLTEKLQKENEKLKSNNENDINQKWIKKVKDKIEELQEKEESDVRSYGFAVETHLALQVLQELLEGRK